MNENGVVDMCRLNAKKVFHTCIHANKSRCYDNPYRFECEWKIHGTSGI